MKAGRVGDRVSSVTRYALVEQCFYIKVVVAPGPGAVVL